jgi:hypothetical protein
LQSPRGGASQTTGLWAQPRKAGVPLEADVRTPEAPSLEERETFWMTAVEQLMETGAEALTDDSDFGRELDAAARGLRHRLRRRAEGRSGRHLRLVQSDLLLLVPALPPFL